MCEFVSQFSRGMRGEDDCARREELLDDKQGSRSKWREPPRKQCKRLKMRREHWVRGEEGFQERRVQGPHFCWHRIWFLEFRIILVSYSDRK